MIKGTVLLSHLAWLDETKGEHRVHLEPVLDDETFKVVRTVQSVTWLPFRTLVTIDKAIASIVGEPPEEVFLELGRHSARTNLGGLYKKFVPEDPHRFFVGVTLHNTFQDFGNISYTKLGDRAGRIELSDYPEYSPAFCASGRGYYEQALQVMKAPGPILVKESQCQCAGDRVCLYDIRW